MGEVFLAIERGALDRFVVIKRMRPELSEDPRLRHMFLSEAKIAALLSHPNIVQIYDVGRQAGYYFIAMQYIHGVSLSAMMRLATSAGELLPLPYIVSVLTEVARALAYVHGGRTLDGARLELVHRDVSPSNVALGVSGEVKVLDFGVAKSSINAAADDLMTGKYSYMSPEMVAGETVDARADLFSLGIMLFELLLGSRPFTDKSRDAVIRRIQYEPRSVVEGARPGVPIALEALGKALLQPREYRPRTAAEVVTRLEGIAFAEGYDPSPSARVEVLRRFVPAPRLAAPTILTQLRHRVLMARIEPSARWEFQVDAALATELDLAACDGALEAEQGLVESPPDVVVAYGADGTLCIPFLRDVLREYPSSDRLLVVSQPNGTVLMRAINEARVSRIITEPWVSTDVEEAIRDVVAERRGPELPSWIGESELPMDLDQSGEATGGPLGAEPGSGRPAAADPSARRLLSPTEPAPPGPDPDATPVLPMAASTGGSSYPTAVGAAPPHLGADDLRLAKELGHALAFCSRVTVLLVTLELGEVEAFGLGPFSGAVAVGGPLAARLGEVLEDGDLILRVRPDEVALILCGRTLDAARALESLVDELMVAGTDAAPWNRVRGCASVPDAHASPDLAVRALRAPRSSATGARS